MKALATLLFFFILMDSVFAGLPEAASVSESFESELKETIECLHETEDPRISQETLELWLKLRYPYNSFGFPRLEGGLDTAPGTPFIEKFSRNVTEQKVGIKNLQSYRPAPEIRALYDSVIELFNREYVYSRAMLQFLRDQNIPRLIEELDSRFDLAPEERELISERGRELLSGVLPEHLRTLRDDFFNRHIMIDRQGRHFSDLHRDFMRTYRVATDCTCVKNC